MPGRRRVDEPLRSRMSSNEHGDGAARLRARRGEGVRNWGPAIVVFGLGLAAWQWLLPGSRGRALPPAAALGRRCRRSGTRAASSSARRGSPSRKRSEGSCSAAPLAFVLALVLARWRPLGNALMPYMIAANAVPIIAFAPITNAWFGTLCPWSKVVDRRRALLLPRARQHAARSHVGAAGVARAHALLRSAPTRRLRARADPEQAAVRLLRLEDRVRTRNDRRCRGGLLRRIHGGAGRADLWAVAVAQYETAWAAILVASLLGIAFYAAVALAERLVLSWHPSVRGAE